MKYALLLMLLSSLHPLLKAQPVGNELMYLKQKRPGVVPVVFASGIVSLPDVYEYGSVFSADGKEFYYAVVVLGKPEIRFIKCENSKWSKPVALLSHELYGYNDPFLSPDESKLFFISDRALDGLGEKKDIDIWYVERTENGWSEPVNAGPEINSDKNEYYVSFTSKGAMYFSSNAGTTKDNEKDFDIRSSPFVNNTFQRSEKLGNEINSSYYEADVFVAPDESYLIYCAERPGGHGQGDLFISFKDENGKWQKSKNMGSPVNSGGYEFCPFVSADGKTLFFSRDGDIYWVDAAVINTLR